MTDDVWYFAYGSNLSKGRKQERTGLIRSARKARLRGYRFAFNNDGGAGRVYANIVPAPSDLVWGVAYLCNPEAMAELDRREGVMGGHYRRSRVLVEAGDEELEAETYIAGEPFVVQEAVPTDEYLGFILTGAREHDLPEEYIKTIKTLASPLKA